MRDAEDEWLVVIRLAIRARDDSGRDDQTLSNAPFDALISVIESLSISGEPDPTPAAVRDTYCQVFDSEAHSAARRPGFEMSDGFQ